MSAEQPVYDAIGLGYASRRRPDPRIARELTDALGDSATDGTWDKRYGQLRRLSAFDSGLRLIRAAGN
jgi:hypothetical protein